MRTDEIRSRLEAATPGPWKVVEGKSFSVQSESKNIACCFRHENEQLIANAPSDLAYLLAECDRKDAEIERLRNTQLALESDKINAEMNLEHLTDQVAELSRRVAESENLLADHAEECAVLRKALELACIDLESEGCNPTNEELQQASFGRDGYIQQAREAIEHGK